MNAPAKLRALLREPPVLAVGCFDPLSARIAELAGFKALHLTGMGVEATQVGAPDLGLLTLTELASHAARTAAAVEIPIIADIDTGFGGLLNIDRTVREMERSGVAGVHIEDQTLPKRCPVLAGRTIVGRDEAITRIKTACDARTNPDFVIVARTDADVVSFDELVERANLFLAAGADMVMPMTLSLVKGLAPDDQMALLRRLVAQIDGPVMTGGGSPYPGYTAKDLGAAGYTFIMFAGSGVMASANALAGVYDAIKQTGTDADFVKSNPGRFGSILDLFQALHLEKYLRIESRGTSN